MKRVHFFEGKLLTAADLRDEQSYHVDGRRRLGGSLHGWGTVCGLRVVPTDPPHPSRVRVEPGLALDKAGREIELHEEVEVDLLVLAGGTATASAVRGVLGLVYREEKTDPEPGAGGGEPRPSRIRESFELVLLDEARADDLPPPPRRSADLRGALVEATIAPCRGRRGREVPLAAIRGGEVIDAGSIDNHVRPLALSRTTRLLLSAVERLLDRSR